MGQINQKYHYDKSRVIISKEEKKKIELEQAEFLQTAFTHVDDINKKILQRDDSVLKPIKGRVVVKLDMEGKNSHTFNDGHKIRLERQYNNLNRRETEPVNAIVVNGENIQPGSEILIHHNSCHPVNQIFNYLILSGEEKAATVKYFSVLEEECFLFKAPNSEEWKPCKGWDTALRIYEPYKGILQGIEPTKLKYVLWITSGEFKDKACFVEKNSEYEIIFQGTDGQEKRVIRLRHFPNEDNPREEIIAVSNEITNKVIEGTFLIGLEPTKAVQYGS